MPAQIRLADWIKICALAEEAQSHASRCQHCMKVNIALQRLVELLGAFNDDEEG